MHEELTLQPVIEAAPEVTLDNVNIESTVVPEKKKRGRPRKEEVKQAAPSVAQAPASSSSIFDDIKKQVNANQQDLDKYKVSESTDQAAAPQAAALSSLLDGYMILAFLDAICPSVIKFIFKKKLANVSADKMMLSESQKNSLEPLADEMAKQLSGTISPMTAFAIAIGSMYYQNAIKALK